MVDLHDPLHGLTIDVEALPG